MEKQFTDSVTEVIGFSRSCPDNRVDTKDCGVSTTEVVLHDQSLQTVERQHVEVQTDTEPVPGKPQYDEAALLEFMRTFAPKIECELRKRSKYFGADFQQNLTDDEEIMTKKIGSLPRHEKIGEVKSKYVSWSCYGNKIAVSFSHLKHDSWCKHSSFILIYECDKNEEFTKEAKECIEINTCIVDLKFHPTFNSILVFATDEGKVHWHDVSESLESNSKNYVYHKGAKITQISWVDLNSMLYLIIADSDGFLYLWTTSSYIKDWKLWRRFTFNSPENAVDRAITCFDFSTLNPQNFVVALEGGLLVQCTTTVAGDESCNPVIAEFENTPVLIISVCFSKFEENVFVTSSSDALLRVYQLNERVPIFVAAASYVPLVIEWSPLQENIFKTLSTDGEIRFYDYRVHSVVKLCKVDEKIKSAAFYMKGMKQLLAAVDVDNNATIWQMTLFAR